MCYEEEKQEGSYAQAINSIDRRRRRYCRAH